MSVVLSYSCSIRYAPKLSVGVHSITAAIGTPGGDGKIVHLGRGTLTVTDQGELDKSLAIAPRVPVVVGLAYPYNEIVWDSGRQAWHHGHGTIRFSKDNTCMDVGEPQTCLLREGDVIRAVAAPDDSNAE
jgi:hypothetical protein